MRVEAEPAPRQVASTMVRRHLIYVDVTPDGELRRSPGVTLGMRIAIAAALVAVVVGGLALGALVLGLALTLLPIALAATMIAYAAFRLELWRTSRSIRRQRHMFRR